MAGMLDYVTSKAGLIGFTRALAREVGKEGIRVNAVMPGAIRTEQEVALGFDENELIELSAERQCIPRRGFAEDLSGTFVYLASNDSSFVSGQVINVDGGWIHY
jgi:3-oxoacyl-[acyl-carrier protein] reductase